MSFETISNSNKHQSFAITCSLSYGFTKGTSPKISQDPKEVLILVITYADRLHPLDKGRLKSGEC